MTLSIPIWISKVAGWVCKYLCGAWLQERKQEEERKARFRALKEELEQNLRIAQKPHTAGGIAFLRFQCSGWGNARGDLESETYLPRLRAMLRNVYADMHEFNAGVGHFEATQDFRLKGSLPQIADRVRGRLEEIHALLADLGQALK